MISSTNEMSLNSPSKSNQRLFSNGTCRDVQKTVKIRKLQTSYLVLTSIGGKRGCPRWASLKIGGWCPSFISSRHQTDEPPAFRSNLIDRKGRKGAMLIILSQLLNVVIEEKSRDEKMASQCMGPGR